MEFKDCFCGQANWTQHHTRPTKAAKRRNHTYYEKPQENNPTKTTITGSSCTQTEVNKTWKETGNHRLQKFQLGEKRERKKHRRDVSGRRTKIFEKIRRKEKVKQNFFQVFLAEKRRRHTC